MQDTTAQDTTARTATAAAITTRDLSVEYGQAVALDGVTAAIPAGAVTAIIGPNGAGKTTLLHAIMGLIPHQRGEIAFFGQPLAAVRRRIAFVPQREAVDWHFPVTVGDVVLMGRYAASGVGRRPGATDRAIAAESLAHVGMDAFAGRQIGALSGGQQQRVFIARALAQQADLLILDEPFTGIDAASQETIYVLLDELKCAGRTVLLSTHDLMSVRAHSDNLLCLNRQVVAFGPSRATFRLDVLERTYGGRLFHLHDDAMPEDEGILLR